LDTTVKEALKIKKLKIVTFDWFEDSLMQKSPKREGPYLLKRVAKKTQKQKAQKKSKVKRAVKEGCKLLHPSQVYPITLHIKSITHFSDLPFSESVRKRLQSLQRRDSCPYVLLLRHATAVPAYCFHK